MPVCLTLLVCLMRPLSLRAPRSDSADASTIVAFFTQRFISRGRWAYEGRTVLFTRGALGPDTAGAALSAQSSVATVGVLLNGGNDLLLLGPDGAAATSSSLLEQLGLQSWREAGFMSPTTTAMAAAQTTAERSLGGLGGGFKRFHWEAHR